MKLYKPNKLFIGKVGYARRAQDRKYIEFDYESIAIVKKGYGSDEYTDIFSEVEYEDFYTRAASGDRAILKPGSLSLFIAKVCEDKTDNQFLNQLYEKILNNKSISEKELKQFLFILNGISINKDSNTKNSEIFTTLTSKKLKIQPSIGRDNEIKEITLSLAESKKITLLVGKRGIGKTAIIDELVYRIKNNNVPKFLKKQMVIELDLSKLFFNPKDTKNIENAIIETIEFAKKNKAIIFIDKIDNLNKHDLKIFELIKNAIEQFNLKIIGTTINENSNKIFLDDIFNKIEVKELDEKNICEIVKNFFKNYSKNNNINIPNGESLEEISNTLTSLTAVNNRLLEDTLYKPYNEDMNNPGLVIEIIDKIFAEAKANNQDSLTKDNIIFGIKNCSKITDIAKDTAIEEIKRLYNHIEAEKLFLKHLKLTNL